MFFKNFFVRFKSNYLCCYFQKKKKKKEQKKQIKCSPTLKQENVVEAWKTCVIWLDGSVKLFIFIEWFFRGETGE